MAFNRAIAPAQEFSLEELTPALIGIGMNFSGTSVKNPNIEDTLLAASLEAMENNDLRLLSVLVTWFGIHHPWINADRLTQIASACSSNRVKALWAALAKWKIQDRRFVKLNGIYKGPRIDLLQTGTDFQIRRHGEDARFAESPIRAPANTLRDRPADILTSIELAKRHTAYRWRVIIGATYRADMWAALKAEPTLTAAGLARQTYGSFATAWHVKRDFGIAH